MKKIFMTLAAVGLFFSCSKENAEPQLQPSTQDAPGVTAVDPNTPGAIRLSLDAEVAPFEVAQESYSEEEGQAARGTRIVAGGPAVSKSLTYRITAGQDGTVPVLVYIHDSKGVTQVNGAKGEVTKDGKGLRLKLGALLNPATAASNSVLGRIANGTAQSPKLSILVGQDEDNKMFTNKGPQLVTYEAGKTTELPDNFVLLKAAGIPLKYDAASKQLSLADGATVSLTMQGYLLGARFQNTFPSTMCRYKWDNLATGPVVVPRPGLSTASPKNAQVVARPPIGIVFRIDNLSATYKASIALDAKTSTFNIGEDLLNAEYQEPNILLRRTTIPGLAPSKTRVPHRFGTDIEHGTRERENFLDATNIGEFFVPVRTLNPNNFSEKEQFVVVYCPNPGDFGSIAYRSPMKLFYDDSPLSQVVKGGTAYFQPLKNKENSFRKRRGLKPENKFHFVTFTIAPTDITHSAGVWTYDKKERFEAYKEALKKYRLN
nr:hypothetical protein [uncultured Porphyromonas sp.]